VLVDSFKLNMYIHTVSGILYFFNLVISSCSCPCHIRTRFRIRGKLLLNELNVAKKNSSSNGAIAGEMAVLDDV